jgi:hypothetical protein
MELKLEAIAFTSAPTKTQLENAVRDIGTFLNKAVGAMLAEGHFTVTEQFIGVSLNAIVQLRQAQDAIAGQANLALPQPGRPPMQMVPR